MAIIKLHFAIFGKTFLLTQIWDSAFRIKTNLIKTEFQTNHFITIPSLFIGFGVFFLRIWNYIYFN